MTGKQPENEKTKTKRSFADSASFDRLLEEFTVSLEIRKYSPASVRSYRGPLRTSFFSFLADRRIRRPQDVTPESLEKYRLALLEKKFSCFTVELYLRAVRRFFGFLEKKSVIFMNPALFLEIPRPEAPLRPVPTAGEMKRLLSVIDVSANAGIRNRAMIETAYSTGARVSELTGMTVFGVDLRRGLARLSGKGGRERMVPLGKHARFWIDGYMKRVRPVFLGDDAGKTALWITAAGGVMTAGAFQQALNRLRDASGIGTPISTHAIRRACATHMLRNGAGPMMIRELLGHAGLGSLARYLKMSIGDLKKTHSRTKVGK